MGLPLETQTVLKFFEINTTLRGSPPNPVWAFGEFNRHTCRMMRLASPTESITSRKSIVTKPVFFDFRRSAQSLPRLLR
jgi:hypothetical protein